MAASYQNSSQPRTGVSYQPQVPDTTFGPMVHVYKPRFDPPGIGPMPMVPGFATHPGFTVSPHQQPALLPMSPILLRPTVGPHGFSPSFGPMLMASALSGAAWHQGSGVKGNPIPISGPVLGPIAGAPLVMQPAVHPPMLLPASQALPFAPAGVAVGAGVACMPAGPGAILPGVTPGMFLQGNGGIYPEPACGIGRTGTEYTAEQLEMAHANKSFEPQDFKPSDDTPSRMYMCRELDGVWTMRSRFSIDRMGKEWRWHMAPEGYFYAVRLPN